MVESAAHLVDHVFPEVPVRQRVLTFPFPLRFLLANDPEALTATLAVVQRGILTFVVQHSGLTVACGARTGAVTPIQRFGSALNLNPHLHMLFLDGAYILRGQRPVFHRAQCGRSSDQQCKPRRQPENYSSPMPKGQPPGPSQRVAMRILQSSPIVIRSP